MRERRPVDGTVRPGEHPGRADRGRGSPDRSRTANRSRYGGRRYNTSEHRRGLGKQAPHGQSDQNVRPSLEDDSPVGPYKAPAGGAI